MSKQNPYELINSLKADISRTKPAGTTKPLESELHDEAQAGRELIAVRPFKANGKQYGIGERIALQVPSALISPRWVTTQARWDASREYREKHKFHRDKVMPMLALVGRYRGIRDKARLRYAATEARLKELSDEIETASTNLAIREDELLDLMVGADLD